MGRDQGRRICYSRILTLGYRGKCKRERALTIAVVMTERLAVCRERGAAGLTVFDRRRQPVRQRCWVLQQTAEGYFACETAVIGEDRKSSLLCSRPEHRQSVRFSCRCHL